MLRCFFVLLATSLAVTGRAEDLSVLQPDAGGVTPAKRFENWLKSEFHAACDRRAKEFELTIKSVADMRRWQADRRAFFLDRIGGLPERTPLNARVVGSLNGKGYRLEKVLLESRPGFHVTANLYLPSSPPPWPGVLVACGHSHEGKGVGQYQRASILLAKHGLAAICYDPVGQGERYQLLDTTQERTVFEDAAHVKTPHPSVRLMCTTEHTMLGLSCALLGSNAAQYRIWDGMRVIDYLQSRPDIIPDKIGCTGNSGGGTETAYLMALDDRIVAAAPGCYLTTFRRLIDTKGPQDGEQNIFGQIAFGMEEADYCIMRAPKPTLICAGTRDATFDFKGTWDLFLDAKRFYSRLGHGESMDINAPDAPHGFTLQQREATTRFMSRWLLGKDVVVREVANLPDPLTDEHLRAFNEPKWPVEELLCSPKGQVLLMPGERSAFAINAAQATELRQQRGERWNGMNDTARRELVQSLLGIPNKTEAGGPLVKMVGQVERDQCTVYKLAMSTGDDVRVGALAFVPKEPKGPATLYLHGSSMSADAEVGGPIDQLVQKGHIVLSAELRGIGETETGHDKRAFGAGRFGPDNLEILTAYLLGKSYVGYRTEDILAWTAFLAKYEPRGRKPTELHLAGIDEAAIPALHAAALRREAYRTVSLKRMLPSWEHLVGAGESFNQSVNVVHGVLKHYDLPDLQRWIGNEKVTVTEPANALGKPLAPR